MPRPSRPAACHAVGKKDEDRKKLSMPPPLKSLTTRVPSFGLPETPKNLKEDESPNVDRKVSTRRRKRSCGRKRVRRCYESFQIQIIVAAFIFINFIIACFRAQMTPEKGSVGDNFFQSIEKFFVVIFTIELLVNMYGSWPCRFWKSGWNWFDFFIVIISLMAVLMKSLPGISVLRLFRAFRVFRLFKRVHSLRIMIEAIIRSIQGVFYAFMIMLLLMAMWSIMGVHLYSSFSHQYFGNFAKGMFTLWQVMSMDSWCSNIARSITFDHRKPYASLFFVSFLVVGGIIMTNVVVAILLETYLTTVKEDEMMRASKSGLQCYTTKAEWKKIPASQRQGYQFHKVPPKMDILNDLSKNQLIELLQTDKLNEIHIDELRHVMEVLWLDNKDKNWMKHVIEKHKKEDWIYTEKKPSFLLQTLLQNKKKDWDPTRSYKPVSKRKKEEYQRQEYPSKVRKT